MNQKHLTICISKYILTLIMLSIVFSFGSVKCFAHDYDITQFNPATQGLPLSVIAKAVADIHGSVINLKSHFVIKITPHEKIKNGELLVLLRLRPDLLKTFILRPEKNGEYILDYNFKEEGNWIMYMHFGPGQAGVRGFVHLRVRKNISERTFPLYFVTDLNPGIPQFAQNLGYIFDLILGGFIIFLITLILKKIRRI